MYYKVGNIEVDTDAHSVLRNGEALNLTPLEFGLLTYLMHHPYRVCTRTEILDKVWGQRFQYDTGTIDVHLNAIRRKLGLSRTRPIETIRGAGLILHTDETTQPTNISIQAFFTEWMESHRAEFENKGLVPRIHLDPFVSEITMTHDELRTMLDGILAALLPSAKPGTIRITSRLSLTHFSLTLAINNTVNELRIPIYGDFEAS
jgi:DNA-binding winged helix-turn-helix (wHTH) protein